MLSSFTCLLQLEFKLRINALMLPYTRHNYLYLHVHVHGMLLYFVPSRPEIPKQMRWWQSRKCPTVANSLVRSVENVALISFLTFIQLNKI